jgi:hypothetical protein
VADDRLQLAYDAGVKALAQQDTTLSNLRNRTTALLTTAGLATSFAAGIGLINTNQSEGTVFPTWAAYTLLALLVVIGALSIFVLWPIKKFAFGPDSGIILNLYKQGDSSDSILEYVGYSSPRSLY